MSAAKMTTAGRAEPEHRSWLHAMENSSETPDYALQVARIFADYGAGKDVFWVTFATLRKETHQHRDKLSKSLNWLRANGWLAVEDAATGRRTTYRRTFPVPADTSPTVRTSPNGRTSPNVRTTTSPNGRTTTSPNGRTTNVKNVNELPPARARMQSSGRPFADRPLGEGRKAKSSGRNVALLPVGDGTTNQPRRRPWPEPPSPASAIPAAAKWLSGWSARVGAPRLPDGWAEQVVSHLMERAPDGVRSPARYVETCLANAEKTGRLRDYLPSEYAGWAS